MHIDPEIKDRVDAFFDECHENLGDKLGIRYESFKLLEIKASMPVDGRTTQPFGLLHGGASVALAETLASIGAWVNIDHSRQMAVGVEINANHLRPIRSGRVIGTATPLHRGAQTHVWQIRIETPDNHLVCISRCTLAILQRRVNQENK